MRIVKQRLCEMLPDIDAFLDVDDLREGKGAEYVDVSAVSLVFCSKGYFVSPNCMRELLRAVVTKKPVLAMLEPEVLKGGLTRDEIRAQLEEADAPCKQNGAQYASKYHMWKLTDEVKSWGYEMPNAAALFAALFAKEPIEWNRIGAFQDVTRRLIAEQLLPSADSSPMSTHDGSLAVYVQDEVANGTVDIPPPAGSFHVYCSAHNPGAWERVRELASKLDMQVVTTAAQTGRERRSSSIKRSLHATTTELQASDRMLVYLNDQTWTRGDGSAQFASDVVRAMDAKIPLLLTHEMNGVGQEGRHPCQFDNFFSCDRGSTYRIRGRTPAAEHALESEARPSACEQAAGAAAAQDLLADRKTSARRPVATNQHGDAG